MAIATTSAGWRSLIRLTLTGTIFQRTSNARSAGWIGYVSTRVDWSEVIDFSKPRGF
jgi:hypothetical protein